MPAVIDTPELIEHIEIHDLHTAKRKGGPPWSTQASL